MDEQEKLSIPEVVGIQQNLNSSSEAKGKPRGRDGGRLSVEEDIALQDKYYRLVMLKWFGNLSAPKTAIASGVSVKTVRNAEAWVKENWHKADNVQCLAEHRFRIGERRKEIDRLIEEAMRGQPILFPNGEPILDEKGKPYIKRDKEHLRRLLSDRNDLDKREMEMDIMLMKPMLSVGQVNINNTQNNSNSSVDDVLEAISKIDEPDKNKLIEILSKYNGKLRPAGQ